MSVYEHFQTSRVGSVEGQVAFKCLDPSPKGQKKKYGFKTKRK